MEKEIYKDIPEYEGIYQVSNYGNVKSLNYRKSGKEQILKPLNSHGYYQVSLYKKNKNKIYQIHKLVAMTFLNHKPDGMNIVVNHIDNNSFNNRLDNLELVSQRHNTTCYRKDLGVSWNIQLKKWQSHIFINKKLINLGLFNEKEDGLRMYQLALNNINEYDGDNKKFRNRLKELMYK